MEKKAMSQLEIDEAVADATGEKLGLIQSLGFSIADPLDVAYDPEPRGPLVLDWDSMCPREWLE
jgi:hypothetical protein